MYLIGQFTEALCKFYDGVQIITVYTIVFSVELYFVYFIVQYKIALFTFLYSTHGNLIVQSRVAFCTMYCTVHFCANSELTDSAAT